MQNKIILIFLTSFLFFAMGIIIGYGLNIKEAVEPAIQSYIIYYPEENGPTSLEITTDLEKIFELNGYKRWKLSEVEKLATVLKKGEQEFGIPYRDMLSLIEIESSFKKYAINKNDGTSTDYGICQVNSRNWPKLSPRAEDILKKWQIDYVDSTYDIALNTVCCMIYLDWSRNHLKSVGEYNHTRWIQSYNVGISGSKSKKTFYKERRKRYYEKFMIAKNIF